MTATLTPYILAFFASFIFVGLKALQQLNVVHKAYRWVYPCSFGMAACELYLVNYMVSMGPGLYAVASIGLGAGTGASLAMYFHSRK